MIIHKTYLKHFTDNLVIKLKEATIAVEINPSKAAEQ